MESDEASSVAGTQPYWGESNISANSRIFLIKGPSYVDLALSRAYWGSGSKVPDLWIVTVVIFSGSCGVHCGETCAVSIKKISGRIVCLWVHSITAQLNWLK